MPSSFVTNIRKASRGVWPEVSASLAKRTQKFSRRDICDETVWALARNNLLRTQSQGELIDAAVKYFADMTDAEIADLDEFELPLWRALLKVQAEDEELARQAS